MKMRFKDSEDMALYFCKNIMDERQWGQELRDKFDEEHWEEWNHWFFDVQDKFIRGKSIFNEFLPEYQYELVKIMCLLSDTIKEVGIKFPCIYTCEVAWADGHFTEFNVKYEYDGQITIDDLMEGRN